ncbi:serine hydrolase [uncultured Mycolicibacterium sp.]|uniref:serine hydrolase n=1 Tax=uncultured Mycolicibacterium sp. TaxID=2320817 RepID=UPI002603339D|nr:serine hydrolase [uncultured Mycolicibacterium sp.]
MAAVLAVAGCAGAPPADGPRQPPPLPPLQAAVDLPEHAMQRAVERLDELAEDLMRRSGIPGLAVAVVHGGRTVYAKGFGVADVRTGAPVGPDTVFQLASLSKPIGATVVAQQVGAGVVDWDTPVVRHLPWFALSDPVVTRMVTVGDLYAHRSGLPDHAGDALEDLGYDRREVLTRLRLLPLEPFRTSYAYTNFGLTAAAEAVAAAAGRPWEELSAQVLYRPLGMTATSSRFADYLAAPDRAVGHLHIDGRYQPLDRPRDPDAQSPAAGVSSSVADLARWMALVLGGGEVDGRRIVDAQALLPALTPQSVSARATEPAMRSGFYGYGFNVTTTAASRVELGHSGAFELGAGANVALLPSADVGIVALTNATPSGVAEALTAQFVDLVQFGEIRQDWYELYRGVMAELERPLGELVGAAPPAHPAPPGPLAGYVGDYRNDYWGPARVTETADGLQLALGPDATFPLRHWDGNVFTFTLLTENAPPGTVSKAVFDGDRLTLEYFDAIHDGGFVR